MRLKSKPFQTVFILILFIILFQTAPGTAGTTGKIKGVVIDKTSGDPLPGANILLEGTYMGAAGDMQGQFVILNIPPGTYTVVARMMGYKEMRIENVRVNVDLTTEVNFDLEVTVLEAGETVTVVAKKKMVVKDLTATTAVVGADEIDALPVTEISEAIELQAGLIKDAGGGLHVRGGRSGEISYWIDGIPVTDVYDGGTVVDVNKEMVQQLQVVSGAFNAEYGQAMSGIVNITTKEGSNKFGGSVSSYIGDHLSSRDDIFMNIKKIDPVAIRNFEGSIYGPIIKDKFFFFLNGRYIYFDGWHNGQRLYNPNAVTIPITGIPESMIDEFFPEYKSRSRLTDKDNNLYGFEYILGTNAFIDSAIVWSELPEAIRTNPDSFSVYYNQYLQNHKNGRGDEKYVPMNWNRKIYAQGKLIYRITTTMKLSYNFIMDDVKYMDYDRNYILNPDGAPGHFRLGQTHILKLTHAINSKTFYNIGVSYFSKGYKRYLYEDIHDSRYVHPDLLLQQSYSFKTGGTDLGHFQRETKTFLVKADINSQITKTHQIKAGVEYRRNNVYQRDISLRPIEAQSQLDFIFESPNIDTRVMPDSSIYASQYNHQPFEISAYIQDKMEFRNMIVNIGVRFDYFEPDGVVLNDETDPSIYNPIKPENRYHDWGTDGIPNTFDPDGTEGNGIRDAGEPSVSLAERQSYWYKDASSKIQISPRIGVSFPITERGVIHFSYGHFFQIPHFERLYQNPDFELGSGTGNIGVIGNADLKPEQTISGEIGLQQQLSENISLSLTGYFRDIRNLTGTRADEIVIFGGSAKYSKFTNSDFGYIRGIILAVNQRLFQGLNASVDYTYQIAKGTNSDPEQARNALAGGSLPEVQLTALNWDQTHTVNAAVSYSARSWGVSMIGQWGSGLPYTPLASADITSLLTNSQRRPNTFNVDFKAYKIFKFGPGQAKLFVRVFNLFDTMNEVTVWDDTGRAGFTLRQETAEATNPLELINSLDTWFTNATYYSEPRRIEIGLSYDF